MNPTKPLPLVLLLLLGCASTEPPPAESAATAQPRRRRRRRATPPLAAVAPNPDGGVVDPLAPTTPRAPPPPAGVTGEFGSPVVAAPRPVGELSARWMGDGRVLCDGEAPAQRASPQSPYEPTNAMIVRGFVAAEADVLGCAPTPNAEGRFVVRVRFSSGGAPQEVMLPETAGERDGLCVGRALCNVRLPAFRAVVASVPYEFVVEVPAEG
jgi:hypothetical protein